MIDLLDIVGSALQRHIQYPSFNLHPQFGPRGQPHVGLSSPTLCARLLTANLLDDRAERAILVHEPQATSLMYRYLALKRNFFLCSQ